MTTPARRALWWAQDYLYLATTLARGLADRRGPEAFATGWRRPVVAIPGILEDWRFLRPLITGLNDAGHPVRVLPDLDGNLDPIERGAELLLAQLRAHDLGSVALVGHSKGGLVGKLAMAREAGSGGVQRIAVLVAIATPFGGSSLAGRLPWPALSALAPGDPSLADLAAVTAVNPRITSIFPRFDPHVPEGSRLAGATNIEVPVAGHFRILGSQLTLRAVLDAIG